MIYICWDCDRQRQVFRHSHGKCRIWGKVPTKVRRFLEFISANYYEEIRDTSHLTHDVVQDMLMTSNFFVKKIELTHI